MEEIDFLFEKNRTVWVFKDRKARKVGAVVERDMTRGEALTDFEGKGTESAQVDHVDFKGHSDSPELGTNPVSH